MEKLRKTFSLNDCPHDKEQNIGAPFYDVGGDGRSLNNHQDISQTSNQYPMALGAPKPSYSKLTLMSSKQLAEHGDNHCWYVEMQEWF